MFSTGINPQLIFETKLSKTDFVENTALKLFAYLNFKSKEKQ